MRSGALARLTAVSILSLLFAQIVTGSGVTAVDPERIVGSVSGDRMMDTVRDLEGFGSRAFYLQSSLNASTYIFERFDALGLDVQFQELYVGGHEVRNVIATLAGRSAEDMFLFGAHYDSENRGVTNYTNGATTPAPGADDDASGVAAVIELATSLAKVVPMHTIKFVAFGAEEYGYDRSGGLRGSAYFVSEEKAAGATYSGTAILDMIGYRASSENLLFCITNGEADSLEQATAEAVSAFHLNVTIRQVVDAGAEFSDHYRFWQNGYPSMLVIEELTAYNNFPVNPYYHTADDKSSALSQVQMTEITKALLGGVLSLAGPEKTSFGFYIVLTMVLAAGVVAAVVVIYRTRKKVGRR